MNPEQTSNLLFITDQHSRANQLIARLRGEGFILKALGISLMDEVAEQLQNAQWDLIICFDYENVAVADVLQKLQHLKLDTPLVFISEVASSEKADSIETANSIFALGAQDVLLNANEDRILFSLKRELANAQLQKQNRKLTINLSELEQRHHLLLNSTDTPFSYISDGFHICCNQFYADFFSYKDIEKINTTSILDLICAADSTQLKALLSKKITQTEKINLQGQQANGKQFPIEITFTPARYEGKHCLQVSVQQASGNVEFSAKKAKLKTQDLLTRLSNKENFYKKVENAIGKAIKHDTLSSIIVVQINEYVDIESTIGKSNTNLMLGDIAQFLKDSIKKSFTAARLDNYVFALLLEDSNPQEAIELAGFIKGKINNHITTTVLPSLQLSSSIGLAVINNHATDAEDIIARARVNLDTSPKITNTNTQFRISESLDHKVDDMINYLSLALEKNRFKLLYQPLVNIKGNAPDGYEVLTRMLDSDGNDIPPNEFFPLANLNGMGEDIDKAVLKTALLRAKEFEDSPNKLIVTITNNSLVSPTFLPWLNEQLQQLRLRSDILVFQLSEIDICYSLDHAIKFCLGLDQLGIEKAVCHFGCAIRPLEYLSSLKPNYVKLDTTIIRNIVYSAHQKNSVQELIKDLHEKGAKVVAPQIEEVDLLPLLWEIGVDFAQGYCLQGPSQEMNYEFIQTQEITLDAPQDNHSSL